MEVKKILSQSQTIFQCREWKRNTRRIVLVTGHFSLLHPGHIRLLERARSYGDILIVGLSPEGAAPGETLESVAPFDERAEVLAALAAVDFVTGFDGFSPDALIAKLSPDVVVMGAEFPSPSPLTATIGKGTASREASAPTLVRLPLEPGYSTKLLLERIQQLPA
jgi:D-glycero-beta-D-manno-heptose 1-phosphate adenylyltransferase